MMTALPGSSKSLNMLDDVRAGFAWVAARARHVRIREDRLPDYAAALPGSPPDNLYDPDHHLIGAPEETAAYTLALDAINFGSGYKDDLAAEGWPIVDNSIYYSIATPLKRYFQIVKPEAGLLSAATRETAEAMLGLPRGTPAAGEFAEICARNLRELGALVARQYRGSFLSFVRAADGSAERMAFMLSHLTSYADIHAYKGRRIAFYKRAQIAAGDLHLAFGRMGETLFRDIDRLTMFPDNGVPHVLRMDGVLEYDPALAARIDAGENIPSGSEEEVELRACAGHAVERLSALTGRTASAVDYLLWHRSVEGAQYQALPAHRTKTIFY